MAGVCDDRERMVITHGEPHAANVVIDTTGPVLVDWESALVAPPERDLWVLDPGDGSVLAAYTEATGVALVEERLDYYRLWYDLFEIAGYIDLFRAATPTPPTRPSRGRTSSTSSNRRGAGPRWFADRHRQLR